MPRKPAHEQLDTLQILRDQAFELFGRNGYEGVSIGDIATATGLSKGALYWHFSSKEALFLDCQARLHGLFDHYIFHPIQNEPQPTLGVLLLFRGLEQLVRDPRVQQGIGGYWLIPVSTETSRLVAAQRGFEQRSQAVLAAALERGVAAGLFNLGSDLDDMARAVIAIVEAVVLPLRHQSPEEVHRILAVLARTFFRAYARPQDLAALLHQF
ncbi:MAG TPA: helix-turn-helix domain-containing protein [Nevskiaceae bacterium]|nr:helix-turn-helix domain-containing protein [Nevskiaceae bacterium]